MYYVFVYLCCPTVSTEALCIQSVHPPRTFTHPDMNGLRNLDETYSEYSLAPADDLIRCWRSKVTAGHRGGEGIHVNAGVSKTICAEPLFIVTGKASRM